MRLFFDDEAFDGQLQRTIGRADGGMANVGECLAIASAVTPGDRESWYEAWSTFAGSLVGVGDAAVDAGHPVSARNAYLRATEYYRQAFFFHRDNLDNAELRDGYAASVAAFRKALPLLEQPGIVLDGDTPGYLITPPGEGPFPTIMHINGYDGTAEEVYAGAPDALQRGWAYAMFDGPGTGAVLYERREYMRPDWENVVPGMVDLLLTQPAVDPTRIALVGRSFGGLLGPRGASGEPRLAAMVVDPGQYDLASAVKGRIGDLWERVDDPAADPAFDALLEIPRVEAMFRPRMVTHGMSTLRSYVGDLRRYECREQAPKITCPTLVCDNETDLVSTGQGQDLFDHLTCPKEFRRFVRSEGAEGHCEIMGQVVFWAAAFDWLERTLAR